MYQVYVTKGEYEPWWFFDDWQNLIVWKKNYTDFKQAIQAFNERYARLTAEYPFEQTKQPFLSAFWNESESHYCESCADNVQIFHGLMLLKDDQKIENDF